MKAAVARYRSTERGRVVHLRNIYEYEKMYPDKVLARRIVNKAVRKELIPAASTQICQVCNCRMAQHYHHHNGYDKSRALDVIPVCVDCHIELDRQ